MPQTSSYSSQHYPARPSSYERYSYPSSHPPENSSYRGPFQPRSDSPARTQRKRSRSRSRSRERKR
jgi:hypothetical protein